MTQGDRKDPNYDHLIEKEEDEKVKEFIFGDVISWTTSFFSSPNSYLLMPSTNYWIYEPYALTLLKGISKIIFLSTSKDY